MAKNQDSSINFNINIKGVEDARELAKLLPKLEQGFQKLAKAQQKYESTKTSSTKVGSRSSSSGGSSSSKSTSITKADVRDRMKGIQLGVERNQIDSVEQLSRAFIGLEQRIDQLAKAGKRVNDVNLQGERLFKRLRKQIEENSQTVEQNTQTNLKAADVRDKMAGIKLGVEKNEINSVQQLDKAYEEVDQQIEKLAESGKRVNKIKSQSYRQYKKLSSALEENSQETQENAKKTTLAVADVRDQLAGIQLGVRNKDIQSIEQLDQEYRQLHENVRELDKAGKRTNTVKRQMARVYDKLSQSIKRANKEMDEQNDAQLRAADIRDKMEGIKLGVDRRDIKSVQELDMAFKEVYDQIRRFDEQGGRSNRLKRQSRNTYKNLTEAIRQNRKELDKLNQERLESASTTNSMHRSLLKNIDNIEASAKTLNRVSDEVGQSAKAANSAAHLVLNAGYLIQDSPYGIRGMANNLSQITQSYWMLSQEIARYNQAQGASLSVMSQVWKMLKGPTGIVLLVGSVLPAALEVASQKLGDFSDSARSGKEALEDWKEVMDEIAEYYNNRNITGENPMDVLTDKQEMKDAIAQKEQLQLVVDKYKELKEVRNSLKAQRVSFGLFRKDIKEAREIKKEIDILLKSMGAEPVELTWWDRIMGRDMPGELKKKMEEIEKEAEAAQRSFRKKMQELDEEGKDIMRKTSLGEQMIEQLSFAESELYPEEKREEIMGMTEGFLNNLQKDLEHYMKRVDTDPAAQEWVNKITELMESMKEGREAVQEKFAEEAENPWEDRMEHWEMMADLATDDLFPEERRDVIISQMQSWQSELNDRIQEALDEGDDERAAMFKEHKDSFTAWIEDLQSVGEEQDPWQDRMEHWEMMADLASDEMFPEDRRQNVISQMQEWQEELNDGMDKALEEGNDERAAELKEYKDSFSQWIENLQSVGEEEVEKLSTTDYYLRMLSIAEDEMYPDSLRHKFIQEAEDWYDQLGEQLDQAIGKGNHKLQKELVDKRSSLQSALQTLRGREEDQMEEFNWFEYLYGYEDADAALWGISDEFNKVQNAREEYQFDRVLKSNASHKEKMQALESKHQVRLMEIRRNNWNDQYDSQWQFQLELLKAQNEYQDKADELARKHNQNQLQLQNIRLQGEMGQEDTYQKRLDNIKTFYDRKEAIIEASNASEMEKDKKLAQVKNQRRQAEQQAEQQLQSKKQQIRENYVNAAVSTFQMMGQMIDADSRKQFKIQKIASASQAIINGYLAFTKTLAQGGIKAAPLAASALAMSIAQAGKIMTQSYDSARATGGTGTSAGVGTSYRAYDFGRQNSGFRSVSATGGLRNEPTQSQQQQFPSKVQAEFTDGFGKVVSEGTIQLHNENKGDHGYWK